jgi:hypothetical protein
LAIRGPCPAIALTHSLLMALSKIKGLSRGATADLPRMGKNSAFRALCGSVVTKEV